MVGAIPEVRTGRLLLRDWREEDLDLFARMNTDPRVMEYFPSLLSRPESDELAARIRGKWSEHGFGPWAVEIPGVAVFAGFVGLSVPSFSAPFTPCVEVGWRLAHARWGQGYATEAARASLAFGFEQLKIAEIVSFTVPANVRSTHVMEKLGMRRSPSDDFDHPKVAEGNPLRRHVLYRMSQAEWRSSHSSLAR
jgi:RimJ/RimL family protein N-acetyltransferase